MKAYVTNPSSLLGASLTGALLWEGHALVPSTLDAEVVFETTNGVVYRRDRPLARFFYTQLLGPGDLEGTAIGEALVLYARKGNLPASAGGACVSDARDVALAMMTAAERGISGEFDVTGPFVTLEEVRDMLTGAAQARTGVALPELGLTFRPVEETVADVIAWERSRVNAMVA